MRMLLPILLLLIGLGGGAGAGLMLRPDAAPHQAQEVVEEAEPTDREYVKLSNQFIIPVVTGEKVSALVVISLSVEVGTGQREQIYSHEPKLRDEFLQVMFDHANTGGFSGEFTNFSNMEILRNGLNEVGRRIMPDVISDVLIVDIVRQDV